MCGTAGTVGWLDVLAVTPPLVSNFARIQRDMQPDEGAGQDM